MPITGLAISLEIEKICMDDTFYFLENELSRVKDVTECDKKKKKTYVTHLRENMENLGNNLKLLRRKGKKKSVKKEDAGLYQSMDKFLFKKPWHRLPEFHKVVKIKEFVNMSNLSKKEKTKMIAKIMKETKNRTIKSKDVTYDKENERITGIKNIDIEIEEVEDENENGNEDGNEE